VIEDISEQKRREGMRQRFLDAVRSSLRAPIATISESLENVVASCKFKESEQKSRVDLQRAGRSARQCILLIDVLLDAQSAQTGSIQIETKKVSVAHVVEESVELVRTIADRKGVGLELETVEKDVVCDPFKLTQTIVNLLSNAIKFSSEGNKIYIAVKEIDKFVEISVTDEGPGISDEYRNQIFEPFVQVPGEKAKEGTGLGLAICKQIIDAHGGEIGVKPTERGGSGSTFWFKIPH
jgi:signal transduction histidine kinase